MLKSFPSADLRLRRHTRLILALAVAFYALVLVAAWLFCDSWADLKTRVALHDARKAFSDRLEGNVASTQWYAAYLVFERLGGRTNACARTLTQMRELADSLGVSELNIVDRRGVTIGSNRPESYGFDYHSHPDSVEYLLLLDPTSLVRRLSQPFRSSTLDPDFYCKYYGEAFDDRSGFIQLGYPMDVLAEALSHSDARRFARWPIGRYGHFSAVDEDHDFVPDLVSTHRGGAIPPEGVIETVASPEGRATQLTFAFAGRLFRATLPAREFGEQRTMIFGVFSLTSALLIFVFAVILVRLALARNKVEQLHRVAEARAAEDLAVARKIQLSSLPRAETFEPDELSFDLKAVSHPAREVGGDYYDFFRAPDGRLALVIADVSGKGVPAALFMHEAKHAFPEALRTEGGLAEAVARMNKWLCANNEAEMFVTAWFALLDLSTGELEYVNAGHNRPYLLPSEGAPIRLAERGGLFLGAFAEAHYRATHRTLTVGDRLVLYTDGVTEAMDARQHPLGEGAFEKLLVSHPTDIVTSTEDLVRAHVADAEPSDDLTLLVLVWRGFPQSLSRMFPVNPELPGICVNFLRQAVPLSDKKRKMRLINAADELIANVASYSGARELTIEIAAVDGACRVVLSDDGVAYNPLAHRDPDTHLALKDRPEGGLGILMAKKLVDYAAWTRVDEHNRLVLVKKDA